MMSDCVETAVHPVISVETIGTAMCTLCGYWIVHQNKMMEQHCRTEKMGVRRRRARSRGKSASRVEARAVALVASVVYLENARCDKLVGTPVIIDTDAQH
ncbi:hypothetical protein BO82DRAFT_120706 [Aspergillus uvarum CBS 121591]|uniref:Uncharacterized protein n=1 Tax=Aspergillus uvarum CBS 121591 TaxID=1448315 RepID=A0A319CN20_9EURO|nr:hypothetical protein BO82DRAFT_120706 [Aspergillus uvarum CBS 121591]PYH80103.1 hypothetical protein BO82DRAFT_120706 [Aspergillus uvarum CBS 121591]